MQYCTCCNRCYDTVSIRKVTAKAAQFIKQFTKHKNINTYANICLTCSNEIETVAKQRHTKIIYDLLKIDIEDESNNRFNGTAGCDHDGSVDKSNDITLYLQYDARNREELEVISAHFSSDATLEIVITRMINTFKLARACDDFILTYILTNGTRINNIDYTLSTTLHQLNISKHAFMSFKHRTNENIGKNNLELKPAASASQLFVEVKYMEDNQSCRYSFPDDETIEIFFSAIIKKFHLNNINPSRLQLQTANWTRNINKVRDKKLIDLGIATEYQSVCLSLEPMKLINKDKRSTISTQLPKIHTNPCVVINSSFLQQRFTIDLSTIRTLIDLKRKIMDRYTIDGHKSLEIDDICLSLNGVIFNESHNHRLLSNLGIHDKTELQADRVVRTNQSGMQPVAVIEDDRSQISSKDKSDQSEVNIYPFLRRKNIIGLQNLGNTCFLNSALQCLCYVPPLTSFFLVELSKFRSNNNHNPNTNVTYGDLTSAYMEFIWNMWTSESKSFSPNHIRNILGRMVPQFSTYRQQDAQECMIFLLNTMNNEMQKDSSDDNTIIKKLFYSTIQSTTTCCQCNKNPKVTSNVISFLPISLVPRKRSFEIHFTLFYGEAGIQHVAVSSNGSIQDLVYEFAKKNRFYYSLFLISSYKNRNEEYPMTKLLNEILEDQIRIQQIAYNSAASFSSSVLQREETLALDQCIWQFLTPEIIEKPWSCNDECNGGQVRKQMKFNSLARVLIVQLKRFTDENGYMRKLDTFINFPINDFNLRKFCPDIEHDYLNMVYDLIAVSNHIGSICSGHYTAYARQSPSDPWYLFNDSDVTPLSSNDPIVSRNAYILIYLRQAKDENSVDV